MSVDRLFDLLPAIYRERDAVEGWPLRALLRVIAEQVDIVEDDIRQLYENWFIETCEEWVVPYIADLIGYRPIHPLVSTTEPSAADGERFLVPRREVANTVAYRKRKGTLALLDDLASATSGWPGRAVELHRYCATTQSLDHLRLNQGRHVDVRDMEALDLIGSAFDRVAHNADVRSVDTPYRPGLTNVAGVGVFIWRLQVYSITHSAACCLEEVGDHCFTFSVLGNDVPLYSRPVAPPEPAECREQDLPVPIRRHAFGKTVERNGVIHSYASEEYYGEDKSIAIWVPGWYGSSEHKPVPAEKIVSADLTDWKFRPASNQIAVDPQLGRIAFAPGHEPERGVWVSYVYGFAADVGGGEYRRPEPEDVGNVSHYAVGVSAHFKRIHAAYEQWTKDDTAHAVIEITDSGVYDEQLHIVLREGRTLYLRAASGTRPTIHLADWHSSRPDALTVVGEPHSSFTLDGLLIGGRGIEIRGPLEAVVIRHSTLVPGGALSHDSRPRRAGEPSLSFRGAPGSIAIERSIVGAIDLTCDEDVDPIPLRIADSIIDANSDELLAVSGAAGAPGRVALTLCRSTVFGRVDVERVELAENAIVTGRLAVVRRRQGCVRFCYVSPGSRTPRRFHCQPDLVDDAVLLRKRIEKLSEQEAEVLRRVERLRVVPDFLSIRYGQPDYARLSSSCAIEIRAGASDQAEMGVFHDLFQSQREANLRARLAEYTPAGVDVGVIWAS
jgi:hypothetical protein